MKLLQSLSIFKTWPLMAGLFFVILSGCNKKDDDPGVRPQVSSTNPVSDATDIPLNSQITATFSETMEASTEITLKQGANDVAGTSAYNDKTVTFTPAADLSPNLVYTATISKTELSEAGMGMLNDFTWSFTTGELPDETAPTVTTASPEHNVTGVALDVAIVMTFSEAIDQSTINASTYTLKQGTTEVTGVITTTATTATFTPTDNLMGEKVYTATITTGVKDLAGNAIAGDHVVTFTTGAIPDTTPPTVEATDPLNTATNVARNKVISVTFSEAMDPTTITASTLTLMQGTTEIAGTVAYSGTTATFIPDAVLDASLTYTATISTGAKDLAGNTLEANTVWEFTTSADAAGLSVVNLRAAGNYVILAKTTITNVPTSAITGDVGLSPAATSFITGLDLTDATGYATSPQVTGKVYAADMASPTPVNLTTAVENMLTAYNDAAARPTPDFLELATGDIGGQTLEAGLYKWTTTVTLPTDVVISGGTDDVWIFQIAGDLTMSSGVSITLEGGAQAKNIFWQVAGAATIGTTAHFEGIILSMTDVVFQTGATINGRALAQAAVILDSNTVVKP